MTDVDGGLFPRAWSPDGSNLFVERVGNRSIGTVDVGGDHQVRVEERPFQQSQPAISPDGRFLAYASDESGEWEIFVRAVPDDGRKWQVSTSGGREPLFSRDGQEIFYRDGDKMMSAEIVADSEVRIDTRTVLFEDRYAYDPFGRDSRNYDVAPDGRRFLMIQADESSGEVVVVLNWRHELERLVPTN